MAAIPDNAVNSGRSGASNPSGEGGAGAEAVHRIVARARQGDEDAFGELVNMYHQRLYGLAYGIVGNADDAQEAVQQAWVKAWSKLGSFKEDSEFFTWLYRVASNTCLDYVRKRARKREDELIDGVEPNADAGVERAPSTSSRPDRELERAETRELFARCLDALSPEHRLVLTLREVDGLAYDEIAQVMGCRKGTVMSRLFYARRQIQKLLEELR